jgi:hypothetical protein
VRQLGDPGHRLQEAEEIRVRGQDPGHRALGVGQEPLQRLEVGRPGGVAIGDQGDLLQLETTLEIRRHRLSVLGVDPATDQDALAARRPTGHERRLGGGGRAVVMGGGDDIEIDELRDQRLVLVDRLERALADLGLIGRVGRVPLAAEQHLVDGRRRPVAIDAGAEEGHQIRAIAGGEPLQASRQLQLRFGRRQIEGRCPKGFGDVGEELVDGWDAERVQHVLSIGVGVRAVGHGMGLACGGWDGIGRGRCGEVNRRPRAPRRRRHR